MIAEASYRGQVSVLFVFPNEPGSKNSEVLVNPLMPLMNYKGEVEHQSGLNLYGKRMVFKFMRSEEEGFKIEFLQDVVRKTGVSLRNQIEVLVVLEEVGG